MNPVLTVSSSPEPEAARIISDGLDAFNDAVVGYADREPLHVVVRASEHGQILGGISGRTSLGLLFINVVYLPEELRGAGIGTRMMTLAEEEARRRGCCAGVLFTINFQAPGFYQRLGWRVFGEIPCDPPGTSRVFLTKNFR
jgi:GNAT superfamily N-acetyltransferase